MSCCNCLYLQFETDDSGKRNRYKLECKFGEKLNPFLLKYNCSKHKYRKFKRYDGTENFFSYKSKFYKSVEKEYQRSNICYRECAFFKVNCYGIHTAPCSATVREDGKHVYFVEVEVKRKGSKNLEMSSDGDKWLLYDKEKDEYYELDDPKLEFRIIETIEDKWHDSPF